MELIAKTYRETIISIAGELIGQPSRKYTYNHPERGQSPETGFDCSGLVRFVLQEAGLYIPDFVGMDGRRRPIRHANEMWDHCGVPIHEDCRSPGDLVFFSREGDRPTHVGIMYDKETYVHAPGKNETTVELVSINFEQIAANSLRRVLYTRNPIGFKSPTQSLKMPTYRRHQKVI